MIFIQIFVICDDFSDCHDKVVVVSINFIDRWLIIGR